MLQQFLEAIEPFSHLYLIREFIPDSWTSNFMMIHICESYGREYDVKFNTQKTHLVVCDYLNTYSNMSLL